MALDSKNCLRGQEQHEEFYSQAVKGLRVQYDYRYTSGVLFSCVKKNLEECRAARDAWLEKMGFVCEPEFHDGPEADPTWCKVCGDPFCDGCNREE